MSELTVPPNLRHYFIIKAPDINSLFLKLG